MISSGSVNLGFVANVIELSTDLHYMEVSNTGLPASMDVLDWLEDLKCILKNAENVSQVINIDIFIQLLNILNYLYVLIF